LFLAAMVLENLTHWPLAWSAIAIGLITILYTYFGGMRSVVWNDCVQFLIYTAGSIAAVFVIVSQLPNGWASFAEFMHTNGKWRWIDPQFSWTNPYTLWAGLIGGAALSLGSHGTDQMMVQRYLSARSQRDAARAIALSGLVVFAQFALFLFIGMLLACFYQTNSLPEGTRNDQVFAYFMIHSFPANTGLIGLMLAAILAAVMSTLSSSLSSSASSVVSDLWLPSCNSTPTEATQVWVTRLATLAFGIIQIAIGIWASTFSKNVIDNALTIAGFSSGILLGWFFLAVATKRVSQHAALFAGGVGLSVLLCVQYVLPMPSIGIAIAFPWLPVIGAMATILAGLMASTFFRPIAPPAQS